MRKPYHLHPPAMADQVALRRVVVVHELDERGLDDGCSDAIEARPFDRSIEVVGDIRRGGQEVQSLGKASPADQLREGESFERRSERT